MWPPSTGESTASQLWSPWHSVFLTQCHSSLKNGDGPVETAVIAKTEVRCCSGTAWTLQTLGYTFSGISCSLILPTGTCTEPTHHLQTALPGSCSVPLKLGSYGLAFTHKKVKGATIGPPQKCHLWHWVQMDQCRNVLLYFAAGRFFCCALHDLLYLLPPPSASPCHLGKQTSWRCVCKIVFVPYSKDNFSRLGKANPRVTGTAIEGNSVTALISWLF